ncbi:hypothetical protein Hokovirus_2_48 [Hokovirus HKV1]|uniref:Uncharacterized protein n=1 Tax=Hokovirus HKV1 TaxID=1977638 RepID=A0A1V0SFR2_9VIRU|nr:hypothetical protein Hokovirus_2_48 [Hokovirus HKV1]
MAGVAYMGFLVMPHVVGFLGGSTVGIASVIGRKMLGHNILLSNFHSTNNLLLSGIIVLGLVIGSSSAFKGLCKIIESNGKQVPKQYVIASSMNFCFASILGYKVSTYALVASTAFFKLLLA